MPPLRPLVVAFALSGCALPSAARLTLPPTEAPLEERVRAYRRNAVTPRVTFFGLQARVGDALLAGRFAEVESVLVNAPPARALLEERNDLRLLGWTLYGAGVGLMLGDAAWVLTSIGRSAGATDWLVPFTAFIGIGAAIAVVGGILVGVGETRTWRALEAYHQWLWRTLAMPRDAVPEPAP